MRPASPLALRARKQVSKRRIRQRAPRHPVGPEAALRLAVTHLMTIYHDRIRKTLVEHARLIRPVALAAKQPHPLMRSVFDSLHSFGRNLLAISPFKRALQEQARKLAASVKQQVASALDLDGFDAISVDLDDEESELADSIYDKTEELVDSSIDRAIEVTGVWLALDPDRSSRAERIESYDKMLDDGLSGILGRAIQGVGLAYGYAFADMNKATQAGSGVKEYVWITRFDNRVRGIPGGLYEGHHFDFEDMQFSWGDKPLTADLSTSGDDCDPGEDINCRCVGAPVPTDDDGLI